MYLSFCRRPVYQNGLAKRSGRSPANKESETNLFVFVRSRIYVYCLLFIVPCPLFNCYIVHCNIYSWFLYCQPFYTDYYIMINIYWSGYQKFFDMFFYIFVYTILFYYILKYFSHNNVYMLIVPNIDSEWFPKSKTSASTSWWSKILHKKAYLQ